MSRKILEFCSSRSRAMKIWKLFYFPETSCKRFSCLAVVVKRFFFQLCIPQNVSAVSLVQLFRRQLELEAACMTSGRQYCRHFASMHPMYIAIFCFHKIFISMFLNIWRDHAEQWQFYTWFRHVGSVGKVRALVIVNAHELHHVVVWWLVAVSGVRLIVRL